MISGHRWVLPGRKPSSGWLEKLKSAFTHVGLVAIIAIILVPIFFIFSSVFKKTFYPVELIPSEIVLGDNFAEVLAAGFPSWLVTTLALCTFTVLLTLLLVTPAAYAFSRFRFLGRKQILVFMLIAQMFPTTMGMVAIYKILMLLGLTNMLGLILLYAGGSVPFYVWFLKGYIDTIPRAVDEAALMDGASRFQIFRKIILPLSKPAIGVISFMIFIFPYNDYILPSIVGVKTLSVGLFEFIGAHAGEYPTFAAGVMLGGIPILIVFLFFQRYLIAGLTRGIAK